MAETTDALNSSPSWSERLGKLSQKPEQFVSKIITNIKEGAKDRPLDPDLASCTDSVLDALDHKHADKGSEIARTFVIPFLGAVSAGRALEIATQVTHLAEHTPLPGFGAMVAGISSLTASSIRRMLGEQTADLYGRYARQPNTDGTWGKVRKVADLFFREPERMLLERLVGIRKNKRVDELVALKDVTDDDLKKLDRTKVEKLAREGMWYYNAAEKATTLGVHLKPEQQKFIDEGNLDKIRQVIDRLETTHYTNPGDANIFRNSILLSLRNREKWTYRAAIAASTAFTAARSLVLTPIVTRIAGLFYGEPLFHTATHITAASKPMFAVSSDMSGHPSIQPVPPPFETTPFTRMPASQRLDLAMDNAGISYTHIPSHPQVITTEHAVAEGIATANQTQEVLQQQILNIAGSDNPVLIADIQSLNAPTRTALAKLVENQQLTGQDLNLIYRAMDNIQETHGIIDSEERNQVLDNFRGSMQRLESLYQGKAPPHWKNVRFNHSFGSPIYRDQVLTTEEQNDLQRMWDTLKQFVPTKESKTHLSSIASFTEPLAIPTDEAIPHVLQHPTATPTSMPTELHTMTPSPTHTITPESSVTPTPTMTPTPAETVTPSATPVPTESGPTISEALELSSQFASSFTVAPQVLHNLLDDRPITAGNASTLIDNMYTFFDSHQTELHDPAISNIFQNFDADYQYAANHIYTDFEQTGKLGEPLPAVEREKLKHAVTGFLQILAKLPAATATPLRADIPTGALP